MSKYFSEKDIEGYKQCFMLYANDGLVSSPEKLGFIMRSLNMKPTLNELKSYFESHKKDGQIDFAEFLTILHQHLQAESPTKEIIAAFKAYDVHKTGHVTTKELRSILTKSGERLTNKDVDMIIQEVGTTKDGKINYEKLVQIINTPISNL